jgi:hypothetical protein
MGMGVAHWGVVRLMAFMGMRMRVLHTGVAVEVAVEVAPLPPNQQSKSKQDDHDTDRYLCSPQESLWEVPPEKHHRYPERQERGRVTQTPRQAEHPSAPRSVALVGEQQSRYRSEVVRIGGVPKAQQGGHDQRHEAVATQPRQPFI